MARSTVVGRGKPMGRAAPHRHLEGMSRPAPSLGRAAPRRPTCGPAPCLRSHAAAKKSRVTLHYLWEASPRAAPRHGRARAPPLGRAESRRVMAMLVRRPACLDGGRERSKRGRGGYTTGREGR